MERLTKFIENLKRNENIYSYDEAATKQTIILQLLDILGWDIFNSKEVTPEFTLKGKKVDYALRSKNDNKVFLEVKRVGEELENHQEQLLSYSFQEGVELAILTNGTTWWFYLPLGKGDWEQRKFYSIDTLVQETKEVVEKFIDFLSKENVVSGKAEENANKIKVTKEKEKILQETLPKAWNMMIDEPDSQLVELLSENVEKVCGYKPKEQQIKDFLKNRDKFTISPPTIEPHGPRKILVRSRDTITQASHSIIQGGIIRINANTLKVEKENFKAMIEGFGKNGGHYYVSIFTGHKLAKSIQNDFVHLPKLLTTKKGNPKPEYPLSDIGKFLKLEKYNPPGKYVAVLDRMLYIENNIKIWNELCHNGIFDIWQPEAPFNSLKDKQDPAILILRIFEINRDFGREIERGDYFDKVKSQEVQVIKPIIPFNKNDIGGESFNGSYFFEDIIDRVKEVTSSYLIEENKIFDTSNTYLYKPYPYDNSH